MMKIVMEWNVYSGEPCGGYDVVKTFESDSLEQAFTEFDDALKKCFELHKRDYRNAPTHFRCFDRSFEISDFLEHSYETNTITALIPKFTELSEWFDQNVEVFEESSAMDFEHTRNSF